jgi:UDP-N-acetylglucosamine 3-dehydrogenase
MKIGIISFAHMHAFSYATQLLKQRDVELCAIWDEEPTRGEKMAKQFNCTYFQDVTEFLQTDLEAVIVCSENAKHREHVVAAARAKKHILCEKPIATEVSDAVEMIRVCEEEGVLLQIAFPVRYSAAIQHMREAIQSGRLGEIIAINATNHGKMPGGWFIDRQLSGGGAATDHIVHVMDIIRWTLNDEVKRVHAELDTRFYDIDVEDCGIVMLEMESGAIVSIDPSWSRPATFPTWGDVTMEIVGTAGTLNLDVFKQSSVFYNDSAKRVQLAPWLDDLDEGLVSDFIGAIKEARPPSISGTDGLRTLEVVKAAYDSFNHKQFVPVHRSPIR